MSISTNNPGPLVLLGSGETSPSGRKIFDRLLQILPKNPQVSILETPAGFELNSDRVAVRVANFLTHHLQNYNPQINIIPARKRGTPNSPDSEQIIEPLLKSDLIFAGPGSPSYTVRQLQNSLAWYYLLARHQLGGALVFSSAAVIALSSQALPVYEIYKVGEDLHWKSGLDFFAPYGFSLVFIPHWNNSDGGDELDTSRCFMGRTRFKTMLEMLPDDQIVIGIDELTALWFDCVGQCGEVIGLGSVTVLKGSEKRVINNGEIFRLDEFMDCQTPNLRLGIPPEVWQVAQEAVNRGLEDDLQTPQQVIDLVKLRQSARDRKDWSASDNLREKIILLGWQVKDTPEGPQITRQ